MAIPHFLTHARACFAFMGSGIDQPLTRIEAAGVDRYALIIREICSRHVVRGPCEHVACAVSQKRLPVVMCHASAFQSGDCHQSHVCVVCAWLNVGELRRFDNQPQHLTALFLHLVDHVRRGTSSGKIGSRVERGIRRLHGSWRASAGALCIAPTSR